MCEQHKHIGGTAVAERTPVKKISHVSEADKINAAGDHIAGLIEQFGFEIVEKALREKNPKKKRK